jgi:hypothetical protein
MKREEKYLRKVENKEAKSQSPQTQADETKAKKTQLRVSTFDPNADFLSFNDVD